MGQQMKQIVEALLFVADSPLSLAQLAKVLETEDRAQLKEALSELQNDYNETQRAFELVEVAGGYRLRTRTELAFWLRKLRRQQVTRLSAAALETLAVIAYKQPVLKVEVERLRGVDVGGVLRLLMEKDLAKVVGRKDLPGRPLIYGTTKRFLETFDLKDLNDLPSLKEMEAILGENGQAEDQAEGSAQGELELIGSYEEPWREELDQENEFCETGPEEDSEQEDEPGEAAREETEDRESGAFEASLGQDVYQEDEAGGGVPEETEGRESEPLDQDGVLGEKSPPHAEGEPQDDGAGMDESAPGLEEKTQQDEA